MINRIEWEKPTYQREEYQRPLPAKKHITSLLGSAGRILYLKLRISETTGLRPIEVVKLKVKNLDVTHNSISPTTAKHGCARILSIPPELTQALQKYAILNGRNPDDTIFNNPSGSFLKASRAYQSNFRELKKKLAKKTNDPIYLQVKLYDLRHWFGTETYMRERDIPITSNAMGHKDYNTSARYIHLAKVLEMGEIDGYITKTVKMGQPDSQQRAIDLFNAGFTYKMEMDGYKYFTKPAKTAIQ